MDLKAITKAFHELQSPPLDDSQRQFCTLPDKYIRLLAPAGSGKTHSLLHRCRLLLEKEKSQKPSFLIFTFTRAARDELQKRLSDPYFAPLNQCARITTLNAFGYRLVRSHKQHAKLITSSKDKYFCLRNELGPVLEKHDRIKKLVEESRSSLKLLDLIDYMKSLGFRHDQVGTYEQFYSHIQTLKTWKLTSHVRRLLMDLAELQVISLFPMGNSVESIMQQAYSYFVEFWKDACTAMYQMAIFTLDDQKYWARILIEDSNHREHYRLNVPRCSHILVDEFQDINPLDLLLLKALMEATGASLTIVGDDDQAIYEWRSATPEFILSPETHFGVPFNTCVLSRNYRCPKNIVEMSTQLIRHNERRVDKEITPALKCSATVKVLRFSRSEDAYDSVHDIVLRLLKSSERMTAALIGRKRSQIVPYQIICASRDIEFCAAEDLNVFLSDAFGDLMEILAIRGRARRGSTWEYDPVDDVLKLCDRVKKYPIKKNEKAALRRFLQVRGGTDYESIVAALSEYRGQLKGGNVFGEVSKAYASAIRRLFMAETVTEALKAISEGFAGLQKDYGKALEDIFYTDPPFVHLADYALRYGNDFDGFLRDVGKAKASLVEHGEFWEEDEAASEVWSRRLHLMTALRAKGKEFDVVVVLDANEGIWPSCLAVTPEDLEQERRLFYVAVTRVRKYLMFVVDDNILDRPAPPSRFLAEMGLSWAPGSDKGSRM